MNKYSHKVKYYSSRKRKYSKKRNYKKKRTQKKFPKMGGANPLNIQNIFKQLKGNKFLPSRRRIFLGEKKITRNTRLSGKGPLTNITAQIQQKFNEILEKNQETIETISSMIDQPVVQKIDIPIFKKDHKLTQSQSFKLDTEATLEIKISEIDADIIDKAQERSKKIIERILYLRNYFLWKYIKSILKSPTGFSIDGFKGDHPHLYELMSPDESAEETADNFKTKLTDLKKSLEKEIMEKRLHFFKTKNKKLTTDLKGLKNFMKTEKREVKNLVTLIRKNYIYDSNLLKLLLWTKNIYLRVTNLILDILSGIEQEYLYVFFDEFNKATKKGTDYNLKDEILITFYMLLPKNIKLTLNFVEKDNIPEAELDNVIQFQETERDREINNLESSVEDNEEIDDPAFEPDDELNDNNGNDNDNDHENDHENDNGN